MSTDKQTLFDTALFYRKCGFDVIPDHPTKKYPVGFPEWQIKQFTDDELRECIVNKGWGIGLRNQEGLDFDNKGNPSADELYLGWCELVEQLSPGLVDKLTIEKTQSGGYHVAWKCQAMEGNQKLASRPPTQTELKNDPKLREVTLIETRGQGGQFMVAPSPGYELIWGTWPNLVEITPPERQILLDCAKTFDVPSKRPQGSTESPADGHSDRPGDIYNQQHANEALELLQREGWTKVYAKGDVIYFRRPGKNKDVSATWNYENCGLFYPFTTNSNPFEANHSYNPFAIYTILEHGGDYKAATRELAKRFGLNGGNESPSPNLKPGNPWAAVDIMPDLPKYARLTPSQEREGLEDNQYLNTYVEFSEARTPMLPTHFHESAALFLGDVAIARRLSLGMGFDTIYPNLYILWVAKTTIFNKSTGMKPVNEIIEDVMPHLRMTSEFSREALIDSLGGKEPTNILDLSPKYQARWQNSVKFAAMRCVILDEASSLFRTLNREINIGMAELLMKGYDCGRIDRETKGGGVVSVQKSYLSFLGATTPIMLQRSDSKQFWLSGLWARFNHLVPHSTPTHLKVVDHIPNRPDMLTDQLDRLANKFLPIPENKHDFPEARCVILPESIRQFYKSYDRALREGILLSSDAPQEELFGIYGRLPTAALKISIILAALDWDGENNVPTIEPAHWYRAQMVAETWRMGAHQLYRELNQVSEADSLEKKIVRTVAQKVGIGEECSRRDIYRMLSKPAEEINPLVDRLIEAGLLQEYRREGGWAKLLKLGDMLEKSENLAEIVGTF